MGKYELGSTIYDLRFTSYDFGELADRGVRFTSFDFGALCRRTERFLPGPGVSVRTSYIANRTSLIVLVNRTSSHAVITSAPFLQQVDHEQQDERGDEHHD